MKKTIRLTESELITLIKRVIKEQETPNMGFDVRTMEDQLNKQLIGQSFKHRYKDDPKTINIEIDSVVLQNVKVQPDKINGEVILDALIGKSSEKRKIYVDFNSKKPKKVDDYFSEVISSVDVTGVPKEYFLPDLSAKINSILFPNQ